HRAKRRPFGLELGLVLMRPADDEALRPPGLDDLAAVPDLAVLGDELPRRSGRELAFGAHAEPVLLDERRVGQRGPQLLGRGADVGDIDVCRFSHWLSPVFVSGRRAPGGAAFRTWRSSARRSPAAAPDSGNAASRGRA